MAQDSELWKARRVAHLSREALAEQAGSTARSIGAYERGEITPSVNVALRLAEVLGQPVHVLFPQDATAKAA